MMPRNPDFVHKHVKQEKCGWQIIGNLDRSPSIRVSCAILGIEYRSDVIPVILHPENTVILEDYQRGDHEWDRLVVKENAPHPQS